MSARPSNNETRNSGGPAREVAVLVDGPWARHQYWRTDLEAIQAASRAVGYPDLHASAVLRAYRPTAEMVTDTTGGQQGRAWTYTAPAPDPRFDDKGAPLRRPDPTRPDHRSSEAAEREALHRVWADEQHDTEHGTERVDEGSLW